MDDIARRGQLGSELADTALLPTGGLANALEAEQQPEGLDAKQVALAQRLRANPTLAGDPASAAEVIYEEIYEEIVEGQKAGEPSRWNGFLEKFPQYAQELKALRLADLIVGEALGPPTANGMQFGDYELLEEIGCGGMGVVHRAIQKPLARPVAVKLLRSGEFSDPVELDRFMKEALAVSQLNHPNIVHIYNIGTTDGRPFISFEFVDGPSLADRLDGTPFPARLAASIVETVSRAIQYANDRGTVHRDLKPANVLLAKTADGEIPKVTDFGACKQINERGTHQRTQIVGTPAYMAPEQLDLTTQLISVRTDVYGLGAILYECLTGLPPFRGESVAEVLWQVAEELPIAPGLLNPRAPRDLETICLKCLQKNPGDRYASAKDVADELNRFLAGKPIKAHRPGPIRVASLWCRRNPAAAALVATLAIGVGGITYQWSQTEVALQAAEIARGKAVANGEAAQQVVRDLIDSTATMSILGNHSDELRIEPLVRAANRCLSMLDKDPTNVVLRTTLTDVYGRLGALCYRRGQVREMRNWFSIAERLWESGATDPANDIEARKNAAKINGWLGGAAGFQADFALELRYLKGAADLWQELIDRQPLNLEFQSEFARHRRVLVSTARLRLGRKASIEMLEQQKAKLEPLIRKASTDPALRKTFAFTCFLLALSRESEAESQIESALWREGYEQYGIVVLAQPNDFLSKQSLAECCLKLSTEVRDNPYHQEAVLRFEEVARQLAALIRRNPQEEFLKRLMVHNCCLLISCHSKVRDFARAESVYKTQLQPVTRQLTERQFGPEQQLLLSGVLLDLASHCWENGMRDAALGFARQAAGVNSSLAADGRRDLAGAMERASAMLSSATVLNQLNDNPLALQQAELSRKILDECQVVAPDASTAIHRRLAATWERIGKIKWKMQEFDAALLAFREAAATETRAFEEAGMDTASRSLLDHRYGRLGYWSAMRRDWTGVAATLKQREELWPMKSEELTAIATEYQELAAKVSGTGPTWSEEDRIKKKEFAAEGARIRRAAENARRAAMAGKLLTKDSGT